MSENTSAEPRNNAEYYRGDNDSSHHYRASESGRSFMTAEGPTSTSGGTIEEIEADNDE